MFVKVQPVISIILTLSGFCVDMGDVLSSGWAAGRRYEKLKLWLDTSAGDRIGISGL